MALKRLLCWKLGVRSAGSRRVQTKQADWGSSMIKMYLEEGVGRPAGTGTAGTGRQIQVQVQEQSQS